LVKRSAIISSIALSRSAINDFRDGWGELVISKRKTFRKLSYCYNLNS
jgi:hypothetical protein